MSEQVWKYKEGINVYALRWPGFGDGDPERRAQVYKGLRAELKEGRGRFGWWQPHPNKTSRYLDGIKEGDIIVFITTDPYGKCIAAQVEGKRRDVDVSDDKDYKGVLHE
ncbi:MAG: hypothetical protein OXB93_07175 [Cytophagales bacterium]|nr:hypothetical protein [Cytophagales bacterium]